MSPSNRRIDALLWNAIWRLLLVCGISRSIDSGFPSFPQFLLFLVSFVVVVVVKIRCMPYISISRMYLCSSRQTVFPFSIFLLFSRFLVVMTDDN